MFRAAFLLIAQNRNQIFFKWVNPSGRCRVGLIRRAKRELKRPSLQEQNRKADVQDKQTQTSACSKGRQVGGAAVLPKLCGFVIYCCVRNCHKLHDLKDRHLRGFHGGPEVNTSSSPCRQCRELRIHRPHGTAKK